MSKTILVIAAHPDDEILGCGGCLIRHINNGDSVHILLVSEGATSRTDQSPFKSDSTVNSLFSTSSLVAKNLSASSFVNMNFPDNKLDSIDRLDLVQKIEHHISEIRPSIIYTHFIGDLNVDHRRVSEAVLTACRPFPTQFVKTILGFEVVSSTDWAFGNFCGFSPNWYCDISDYLSSKLQLLRLYESEMRSWPHARSLDSVRYLAHLRGSQIGVDAAESFVLMRHIS